MKHPTCPHCKNEMRLESESVSVIDQTGKVRGIGDKYVCDTCDLTVIHNFTQVIHANDDRKIE